MPSRCNDLPYPIGANPCPMVYNECSMDAACVQQSGKRPVMLQGAGVALSSHKYHAILDEHLALTPDALRSFDYVWMQWGISCMRIKQPARPMLCRLFRKKSLFKKFDADSMRHESAMILLGMLTI